jgi:hypothetical protein
MPLAAPVIKATLPARRSIADPFPVRSEPLVRVHVGRLLVRRLYRQSRFYITR